MSKSTKKLVKEYIDNCTIHGVPRLVKSKNTLLRIFWFLLIISSLGGCSFFILSSTMDYLNYDVISNFNVHNSVPMELPTVTICNMNSYKHKMNYTIDQMLIKCRVKIQIVIHLILKKNKFQAILVTALIMEKFLLMTTMS